MLLTHLQTIVSCDHFLTCILRPEAVTDNFTMIGKGTEMYQIILTAMGKIYSDNQN